MTKMPVHVVAPPSGLLDIDWREVWESRELLMMLAWRDVSVRYRQTVLGVAWALLQPLAAMAIFTVVFGRLAGLPSDGVPYPLFTLAGLAAWNYVAHSVGGAANSLVDNAGLMGKVYFPRLVLPAAVALAATVDFLVTLALLFAALAWYRVPLTPQLLLLPVPVALMMGLSFGLGLGLAALNAQYRDFRYVIPFLLQMWLYASPVAYSTSLVPQSHRALFALNPMVGVLEGLRACILGKPLDPSSLALSALVTAGLLVVGLARFMKTERTLTDFV